MLSDTLSVGLQQYRIGPKLRGLRLKKKLGLVELGRHTGLSAAMLSKIERGLLFPTLPTLLRIAMVFNVGLEHFFVQDTGRPQVEVIRKRDRVQLPDRPGAKSPAYLFESLYYPVSDSKIIAFHAEFPRHGPAAEPHQHNGAELIYMLRGSCRLSWKKRKRSSPLEMRCILIPAQRTRTVSTASLLHRRSS